MSQPNSAIRRDIAGQATSGKFDVHYLVHIARYARAAEMIIQEAERLGRPVRVSSLGCGDMWELKVLWSLHRVRKADVLERYVGVDVVGCDVPVGSHTEGVRLTFRQQDLAAHPMVEAVNDGTMDLVLALESLEHIGDRAAGWQVLIEARRQLREGGVFYLSTPNADNKRRDPYHAYEWRYAELRAELDQLFDSNEAWGTYLGARALDEVMGGVPRYRFSDEWLRVVAAGPHPEKASGVTFICRK